MNALEFIAGLFIVGAILYDVFEAVVVPRWSDRRLRLSPYLVDKLWPRWRDAGFNLGSPSQREDFLGNFAPAILALTLFAWIASLIVGFGLMLHASRDQTTLPNMGLGAALYSAGANLLTIGDSDFLATGALARIVTVASAAAGLAVFALVISLTFTLYGSFARREVLVLTLDARAGAPPSGVTLLETYARFGMRDGLPALFAQWETWSAEMLESHLAYPILPFFRSSHDNESWISAMGAVLDAATLVITTLQEPAETANESDRSPGVRAQGAAHLMYALGCHATIDLSHWFRFQLENSGGPGLNSMSAGVERQEFDLARTRLEKAGYVLRPGDEAWQAFQKQRGVYAPALNALARYFATPPTQWIGDRSTIAHIHHRATSEEGQETR